MTPPMCLQLIESFLFGFHFSYFWSTTTQILEKRCHELFVYFWQISLWLWHHTFYYKLLHLFLVKLVFEARFFQLSLFGNWHLKSSFEKEKKSEIYRHKSTHVLRSSETIDQSFMTSLKIYLQQSNVDF